MVWLPGKVLCFMFLFAILAADPQGAHTSSVSVYVRNIKKCFALTQNESPGGTPYNDLYGEAPPERGTFFRLQV